MYYLEQFILKNEYVASVRESNFMENWAKKRHLGNKRGGKRTGVLLKAAMGGVREN